MNITGILKIEVKARRWVLLLGTLCGLFAWIAPLLTGHPRMSLGEARWGAAAVYAIGTMAASALVLGAGLSGPDLQEGRMGYFLARPITPLQIYLGRFSAVLGLTLLSGLLVVLPTWLTGGGSKELLIAFPIFLALMTVLILVSDLVSVALRSQSPWLLLDGLSALILWGLLRWQWGVFRLQSVEAQVLKAIWVPWVLVLVTFFLASYLQLASGRTQLLQAHRAQSLVLAGGLAVALLAASLIKSGLILA